jgi:MbtH protein
MMENLEKWIVVKDEEDRYSVWSTDKRMPNGWTAVGFEDSRQECLEEIKAIWSDPRPASLRQAMAANGRDPNSSTVR